MSSLIFMIPIALLMGGIGLAAFLWSVRAGQFDDPDGAAHRILITPDKPIADEPKRGAPGTGG
ncbi:cbb3-type cytochrome oxidase assembly protein CcoS [Hyphomonas sp.]|uniref:cbb3-type cytochrome oxidase assembly protein CcoS n=1 Tax=Hyphomonas sp. TaxID=87 RepID=UPI00391C1345